MATNAPYYQMRAGQLSTGTNSSTAAAQTNTPQNGDYGLAPITAIKHATENQHLPLYPEHAARQPGADRQQNDFEENHNLVELLEAATTAADQDPVIMHPAETAILNPQSKGKRKRGSSPLIDAPTSSGSQSQDHDSSTVKRRRIDASSTHPSLRANSNDTTMRSPASNTSPSPSRDSLLIDARAAGVHSAAALFRRTSSNPTRKYTRPPMSKLFMSLNITPENFIALQALAKTYMLSPAHPERQSCVGNRGKGDTDMVKLRLFNCVRDFLADGLGEKFFGEQVEKPGERENSEAAAALGEKEGGGEKLVWPRDGNKIISLVTPLMRRMVTNERQRLYAIDTRKGGKKAEKDSSVEASIHQTLPAMPVHDVDQHLQTALDPTLQRPAVRRPSPSIPTTATVQTQAPNTTAPPAPSPPALSSPTTPLALSPTDTVEPHLTNINIFLTYTPSTSKSIKLDEKRISTTRPAHLTFYNYTAFLEVVSSMVYRAELLHPSVKTPRDKSTSETTSADSRSSESLVGLAAAANALQPDKDEQQPQSVMGVEASGAKYTVKTIGTNGWQVIDSAESWYHVLTERAFAMWADGVCNVIVEFGGAQVQTVARKVGGVADTTEGEVQMEGA